MLLWILHPLRLFVKALSEDESPRQLALGFTLGMILGLVPKGNLLAVVLTVLILGTHVNVGVGMASAVIFSWVSLLLDPFAERIGKLVLCYMPLQPVYAKIAEFPVVPWFDLNNTVVMGQFLLGLYFAYPTYWLSIRMFRKLHPWAISRIRKYRITRFLFGLNVSIRWGMSD